MSGPRFLSVWIVLLVLLVIRFSFVFGTPSPYKPGETVSLTGTLHQDPQINGNTQRFQVNGVRVVTTSFPRYQYGNTLRIVGKIGEQALTSKRQIPTVYFPKIEAKKTGSGLALIGVVRQHISKTIEQFLPGSLAALLSGILLGGNISFSDNFFDALRSTGTLHVVAASGMNVSILAAFLMAIFIRIVPRHIAALFVVAGIFFYAGLASFQPSIVRASAMGILVFSASILNRGTLAILGLVLACYTMLLFDPQMLFDIGFQLSVAATAGLLFLKPLIATKWDWFKKLETFPVAGDSFTTTVVAQTATLPILLSNFGTVSLLSIPVNTLVLWTVQPIMVLGIAAAIASPLPLLSALPLMAALPLLSFFEWVVLAFNKPQFLLSFQVPFIAAVGYYLMLIGGYLFLVKKSEARSTKSETNSND